MNRRRLILFAKFALVAFALIAWWVGQGAKVRTDVPAEVAESRPAGMTSMGVAPAAGDVLRVAYADEPETLNPLTAGDATTSVFQSLVYEPLADRDLSQPDVLRPRLAERWTFDTERLECTVHLRRGVRWHPITLPTGVPLPPREVTARDVKFTFDCLLNPHIPAALQDDFVDPDAATAGERVIVQVEVVDDYTVVIRWLKPYFLAEESTLMVGIIPRHVFSVDEWGDLISLDFSSREFAAGFNYHWAATRMCGTGPYRFVDWRRDERLILQRNPHYWGPPVYFSRLVFTSEPNVYTAVQKLLQGDVDWTDIDEKDLYRQTLSHPAVAAGGVQLKVYEYPGYKYIGYNLRRPLLRDKRVRRALAHAVPVPAIIDAVYRGLARQVTGPFLLHSRAYNERVQPIPFDLDRARELLDEAGWTDTDGDGVRDRVVDGARLPARINLLIEANSGPASTLAQIVQSNCRKVGVQIDITPAQQSLISQRARAKDFDAVLRGWALSWNADPYQTWFGGNADLSDTSNIIGYRNSEVDQLVQELRTCFDVARQTQIYHRVHELLYDDQPYLFLFTELQTAGYSARLQNVRFFPIKPCVDYRAWYADRPAAR